jgi:hypothetical protein
MEYDTAGNPMSKKKWFRSDTRYIIHQERNEGQGN